MVKEGVGSVNFPTQKPHNFAMTFPTVLSRSIAAMGWYMLTSNTSLQFFFYVQNIHSSLLPLTQCERLNSLKYLIKELIIFVCV